MHHAQCMEQLLRTSLPAVLVCPGGGLGGRGGTVTAVSGSEVR